MLDRLQRSSYKLAFTLVLPLLAGGVCATTSLPSVDETTAELLELGQAEPQVMTTLRTLTAEHPHRLTGSRALLAAHEWARDTFASYGLEARLEQWGEFPTAFDRGVSRGRVCAPYAVELSFITRAWSAGTQGAQRAPAVLEPRTEEELDSLAGGLAGRWVVLRLEAPDRGVRRRLWKRAEEEGALGCLQASRSDLLIMSGNYRADPRKLSETCRITVLQEQQRKLIETLEQGVPVELEFEIENRFTPGPVPTYNVIADLRGSELPDEYVIVQGHVDAWDGAEGAQDNGTGVATTLEAARLLTAVGARPKRTIRFVLYSGEEQGLFGSSHYVKKHAAELPRVSLVLNHDMGGSYLRGISATSAMKADFEHVFGPLLALDPARPFTIRPVDGLRGSSSDHAPFVRAGVPAFAWHQSFDGYRRIHHTQHDLYESCDAADLQHSALVVAVAAWRFAELEGLVDRTEMVAPGPRIMGVRLEGTRVERVFGGSRAAAAGWRAGDRIVSIDGRDVDSRGAVVGALQEGGAVKFVVLERDGMGFESLLDYSDDPEEVERAKRRLRRSR